MRGGLIILLLLMFNYQVYSQTTEKGKIRAVTSVLGAKTNALTPKGNTFPFVVPKTSKPMIYELKFVEYVNNQEKAEPLEEMTRIFWEETSVDRNISFSVIPDISRKNHFILFSYIGYMTKYSHRKAAKDSYCFNYKMFEDVKKEQINTAVPLMIVYENDESGKDILETFLKIKNDRKLRVADLKKITSPNSPVKKYSLLFYTLKEKK